MFRRMSRGWEITKAAWSVLKLHPKLALLPVLSALALAVVLALIVAMAINSPEFANAGQFARSAHNDRMTIYPLLFVVYFVSFFVVVFFNSALIFCSLQCFAGHEPSLTKGLATAAGRLPQILMWALVASTVGLLLQALEDFLTDKLGFLGALLGGVGQVGWAAITYFVVPVLVVEGTGPVEAVKRSSAILRQTWGEAVSGEGGLGLISMALILPAIPLAGLLASNGVPPIPLFVFAVLYGLTVAVVFSTLGTLFRTGVYVYATTGKAPAALDAGLLQGAFKKK